MRLLSRIIYLQPISDVRIGQSGMRALNILEKICDVSMNKMTLATTRWGNNPDNNDEVREKLLRENAWSLFLSHGNLIQRYMGIQDSALKIVRDALAFSGEMHENAHETGRSKTLEEEVTVSLSIRRRTSTDTMSTMTIPEVPYSLETAGTRQY